MAKGARIKTRTSIKQPKSEIKTRKKVRNPNTDLNLDPVALERAKIRAIFWYIQYLKKHPEALQTSDERFEIELRELEQFHNANRLRLT